MNPLEKNQTEELDKFKQTESKTEVQGEIKV
jgi:hypothetical protein